MSARTLLMVTAHPLDSAGRVGQRRSRALRQAYGTHFSRVVTVSVVEQQQFPRARASRAVKVVGAAGASDLVGWYRTVLRRVRPDAIAIEGAGLYPMLREALAGLSVPPAIIYSARPSLAVTVEEPELIARARVVLAADVAQGEHLRAVGAGHVAVLEHVSDTRHAVTEADLAVARQLLAGRQVAQLIVAGGPGADVGAAALLTLTGTRPGYLGTETALLVSDNLEPAIAARLHRDDPFYGSAFWSRAFTTDPYLPGQFLPVAALADVIVLPTGPDDDARLSLAEAVATGARVIAAPAALVGAGEVASSPSVTLAADRAEFRVAVEAALAEPARDFSRIEPPSDLAAPLSQALRSAGL